MNVTGIFNPCSCILWIYNPVKHLYVKRISLFRITNSYSTESWITYPVVPFANFTHYINDISGLSGQLNFHANNFSNFIFHFSHSGISFVCKS